MAPDFHELGPFSRNPRSPSRGDEHARLNEILEIILAVAANDFSRRATIATGDHILDGIASGLNMLIEELERHTKSEAEVRARLIQAERLAAIGMLAAGVAHEINNPAAFLLANFVALTDHLDALRGHIRPENAATFDEIAEIARVGQAGVERIATIVRGLRDFSRIEDHEVTEVRVDEIAEQACTLASREITHHATLVKKIARVKPIFGERTRLTQLVTSILINAAHAIDGPTDANEVELTVTEDEHRIFVRVRDTGRGIPLELQSRVFQPFFTTKPRGEGTGLGLSVAADIARQHGGVLRFTSEPGSEPGHGTTFELELPIVNGLAAPQPVPAPATTPSATRRRVLFIDDEEQLLRAYRRMLRDCDVVVAGGGQAGIDELVKARESGELFDAIFCDISMPEVDGTDVWRWIEANAPELAPRVLFCTGGAFTARAEAFVAAHEHRIVAKPVGRERLQAAVEQLVLECGRARVPAPGGPLDPGDRG